MSRNAAIDHLRIGLTALVILHHVAIVYGGSGGWYWREAPNASSIPLLFFNALNQSFFMGFFFLLAGYFSPQSLEKKGVGPFFTDRLKRLGIPLLGYFFILSPLTNLIVRVHAGESPLVALKGVYQFPNLEPGPLWFCMALLLFAGLFVGWRTWRGSRTALADRLPGFAWLFAAAIALGLLNFGIRLVVPVGESILWQQLGYYPCYLFLFFGGCWASRSRLLESLTFPAVWPWLIISIVCAAALPFIFLFPPGEGAFEGGWNLNALTYALWDPLVGWGIILALLWAANKWARQGTRLTTWLARNAYAAFVIHPPVIVTVSLLIAPWSASFYTKFLVTGSLSCVVSAILA